MPVTSRRSLLALPVLAACGRNRQKLIGVVPKATSHLFFVSIHEGVNQAAREFGVEVQWNGPNDETDHARQIQIVDAMVTRGVDAIAVSATDERALAAPIERAIKAGIPVTMFDSGANVEGYVTFVATDNLDAGRRAAREIAALIGGKGDVAMVMQKPGGTSTGLREQGFEETIAKEYPAIKIVAKQFGMADRAKSRTAAENILTAHPTLDAVFASSEAASIGSVMALRARGRAGKTKLVAFDFSDIHIDALRDGTIDVMLVQEPVRIGYEAVKSLALKLRGETPQRRLDLPARRIAKADLDNPEIQALLRSPSERSAR